MSELKHHQVTSRFVEEPKGVGGGEGGGQRVLPPHVRRRLAKKSSEGGRARCCECEEYFSVTYMSFCQIDMWRQDWVCADCRADKKYRLVPRR